jgi:hypothetical protein
MRKMDKMNRKFIEGQIRMILISAVSSEYVGPILSQKERGEEPGRENKTILEDIIEDVLTSSAWDEDGYYNDDDIRLAIGRVLIDRLGIEY